MCPLFQSCNSLLILIYHHCFCQYSLSNAKVQAILVEAARPRTREMCARELILFLGKDIPQSPPVNPDNFSKLFYGPKRICNSYVLYSLRTPLPTATTYLRYLFQDMAPKIVLAKSKSG